MSSDQGLEAFVSSWAAARPERQPVAATLLALAGATAEIARMIAAGSAEALGATVGGNAGGDAQKALDVAANDTVLAALAAAPVAALASEELDDVLPLDRNGRVAVAIDPLDGSSNIDTNAATGTIFSILPVRSDADPDFSAFFAPGRMQLAAGFAIYGPQTMLVFSLGSGTHLAQCDPATGAYHLVRTGLRIPAGCREFAINASNRRFWGPGVRAFVDDCLAGKEGPRGADYNMRWNASVVAEAYRILRRGGVFLYPRDARKGYGEGRLRLIYEANPIAFLMEQAGGAATNGINPILDLIPTAPHQRTPLVFGDSDEVERVRLYKLRMNEVIPSAPLFNRRGLYRN
jgi:fructose-1,6-bisphosphatase I